MNGRNSQNGGHALDLSGAPEPRQGGGDARLLAGVAREEYHARRRRERHIDACLLGEPAWDILLDLFISAAEDRLVSVTSVAIASQVPPTTALRYFAVLEKEGLIARRKSQTDARVTFLGLTDVGYARVGACLRERLQAMHLRAA